MAPGGDPEVAEEAVRLIDRGGADLLFVHLDGVDHAGHTFGFSPYVPFYMWAVEKVDGLVGRLTAAVRARQGEEWLIVVTSDHGGHFRHHGENIPSDRTVILIANGPGCVRERPRGFRGVVDVAPTVFAYMGLPVDPAWNWDGRPLGYAPAPDSSRARFAAAANR
jgi:arylsulfatase A-like enzyme